ncbi:MAG TPA: HEAT repeat domain-containing protein [Xanthobacteraceae bacterium]|nr:HEAT repeat domain-containing protein [Xanthobacteraceae bacterium]
MASTAFERFRFGGVIGLGALGSRRAEPALVKLFEAEQGSDSSARIYLAKALLQIRPDPRWLDAVTEVLASADEPMQRLTAVEALYHFRDPASVRALVKYSMIPKGWCATMPPADCSRFTVCPTIPRIRST